MPDKKTVLRCSRFHRIAFALALAAFVVFGVIPVFFFGNPQWHRCLYLSQLYYKTEISSVYHSLPEPSVRLDALNEHKDDGSMVLPNQYIVTLAPSPEYTGVWRQWYPTGQLLSECKYLNGKRHGVLTVWNRNGNPILTALFTDGSRVVQYADFYASEESASGQKRMKERGVLFDDEPHGVWEKWYPGGSQEAIIEYDGGVRDGRYWQWNREGILVEKGRFRQGQRQGLWTYRRDTGTIHAKGNFSNGKREGSWSWWYDNGQLEKQGRFLDDKETGIWRYYHYDGALAEEGEYLNGLRVGTWKRWRDNGTLAERQEYRDGKRHGLGEFWDSDGNREYTQQFKDDIEHGQSVWYWDNGTVQSEGTYGEGRCVGKWHGFTPDGAIRWRGQYRDGKRVGVWKWVDTAGATVAECEYRDGNPWDGVYCWWDPTEAELIKIPCRNGTRLGQE